MALAMSCWYDATEHLPSNSRCPEHCDGPILRAELCADGDRFYCARHGAWRATTTGVWRLRDLTADELR